MLEESVRLTTNEKGRSGQFINRRPFFLESVELTLEFRVHSAARQGADGLALWLTDSVINKGPVFGGPGESPATLWCLDSDLYLS